MSAINIRFAESVVGCNLVFIEVENDAGASIGISEWKEDKDGYRILRITELPEDPCIASRDGKHTWKDARNKVIVSGEYCTKCGTLRGSDHTPLTSAEYNLGERRNALRELRKDMDGM